MPLPDSLSRLKLPLIAAPLFLISGPQLVIAACRAGVVGTFPALNARTTADLQGWLEEIEGALAEAKERGEAVAPYGVNLIVHKSNPRLDDDLALCIEHRVPLVITSLGANQAVVEAVQGYGGQVFHDVINLRHARKAAAAGVDGLIAVAAGAGGHAGTLSPFALVNEIRQFFAGILVLAGALSRGSDIAAARVMGADLAYMGTRFINTRESRADAAYQAMITAATAEDIVYTAEVSGVAANFLRPSLVQAGRLDDSNSESPGLDLAAAGKGEGARPWKDIWSAGQGVGSIRDVPEVATLVERLSDEYRAALQAVDFSTGERP